MPGTSVAVVPSAAIDPCCVGKIDRETAGMVNFRAMPGGGMRERRHADTRDHRLDSIDVYARRLHGLRGEGDRVRADGEAAARAGDPRLTALTEQWVSLVNTVMDRTLIRTYLFAYIAPKTADGAPDRAAIDAIMPEVREQIGVLDRAVAGSGHLVGDQFTFANLLPILHRLRQAPEGAEALAAATHLAAYYDRHAARPSFERTMPPAGPPRRQQSG